MRTSILAIASLGMAAAPAMASTGTCSPDTIQGFWAFNCDGHATALPPAAPSLLPMRFFGTCGADRTEFINCEGTLNVGGQVVPVTLSGQANTKHDCTGTITYDEFMGGSPIGQLLIRYTVLDGGDTIWGTPLASVPASPQVFSCHLRRVRQATDD